jgi:hypothetical protein
MCSCGFTKVTFSKRSHSQFRDIRGGAVEIAGHASGHASVRANACGTAAEWLDLRSNRGISTELDSRTTTAVSPERRHLHVPRADGWRRLLHRASGNGRRLLSDANRRIQALFPVWIDGQPPAPRTGPKVVPDSSIRQRREAPLRPTAIDPAPLKYGPSVNRSGSGPIHCAPDNSTSSPDSAGLL